ncbi:MAG TPA: IPT/TIG domain-containing protein [Bryobacteraceae bacterium]|nr:IPT/TIG domain-containing protein [Bryobacteraceae bacterium]
MRFFLALASCVPLAAQTYTVTTIAGGTPAPAVAAGSSLALGGLGRVGVDPAGDVYFTALNSVYRLSQGGTVTRVAGNGRAGFSGDGGPALGAQLNSPQGVVVDTQGNIYISDTGNNRIRLVSNGVISTFAGNGKAGSSGDYGDPLQAELHIPLGLALDTAGNLYIADSANNVIRQVSGGIIYPFAGNYIRGESHDGGPAIDAALSVPSDLAFDSSGNLYIADTGNGRIRQVNPSGIINTVVGGGTTYTEGGAANATVLAGPTGVAIDSAGDIFIADRDGNHIYKVTASTQKITTVMGNSGSGFAGDGGSAATAEMNSPTSIQVDPTGDIFFVDLLNARIREINASGNIMTLVGNGLVTYSGDGGAAQNALMNAPSGVVIAPSGVVYIADTNNQRVRMIASDGTISTVAGNGTPGFAGDGSTGASAQVNFPTGLATDASGNVYISDTGNQRVRMLSGGSITTVAGNGAAGYGGDGGPATSAQINSPAGLAVDKAGNLYIADFSNNAVRKVAGGTITTIAGTGAAGYAGDGGPAAQAQLNGPAALALDSSGNLYIADSGNHVVRKISPGGIITTIAGNTMSASSGDGGLATAASLAVPNALAADSQGNVYIADASANRVRMVTAGGLIVTIAGAGTAGYSGDNGPAINAQFNGLAGISLDASGNIYVADRANNAIRLMQLVSAVPSAGAVTNSASNLTGPIAPGEALAIYGSGLGPSQLTLYQPDDNGNIPTQTGGTTVYVNGVPAPVVYSWSSQVGIVVPYEVTPGSGGITVQYSGQISLQLPVTIAPTAPGLFTADASGKGQAVAINEADGSLNTASNPVEQGGVVHLYATGYGLVTPVVPDGAPNNRGFAFPLLPVTATVNGQAAVVQYAGGDPGLPAGTIRVDVRIPAGISGSATPVAISIGGVSSQPGVTIAVASQGQAHTADIFPRLQRMRFAKTSKDQ